MNQPRQNHGMIQAGQSTFVSLLLFRRSAIRAPLLRDVPARFLPVGLALLRARQRPRSKAWAARPRQTAGLRRQAHRAAGVACGCTGAKRLGPLPHDFTWACRPRLYSTGALRRKPVRGHQDLIPLFSFFHGLYFFRGLGELRGFSLVAALPLWNFSVFRGQFSSWSWWPAFGSGSGASSGYPSPRIAWRTARMKSAFSR